MSHREAPQASDSKWVRSVAITGAGSGFGAAMARYYAAAGWRVALTDQNAEAAAAVLDEIVNSGGSGFSQLLDVTQPEHWQQLKQQLLDEWGGVHTLINNAGVAVAGNLEETPWEDWRWVVDIDLMGVALGCHSLLPVLREQNKGYVVNVASFAGFAAAPGLCAYSTAKAGVIALSESLRAELAGTGVGVSVLCPAFVRTNLTDSMRSPDPQMIDTVQRWMETSGVTADEVAAQVFNAQQSNQFMILTHAYTKRLWRFKRWLPERYFKALVKRISGRQRKAE